MSVNIKTIGELDSYLFFEGTHTQSYGFMGAHETADGWDFALWAPNAQSVCVVGDFNNWKIDADAMEKIHDNGLWYCNAKKASAGDSYRFSILTLTGERIEKCDPYARACEADASVLYAQEDFLWSDEKWLAAREKTDHRRAPMSIYEVQPSMWQKGIRDYRALADALCKYVSGMGYTHVALTPQCEHDANDALGYRVTSYFAVDHRMGGAEDFKYFVDTMHAAGIGVMLDFVPSRFHRDAYSLAMFDGSPCYEPLFAANTQADASCVFNYGRNEVRSFLSSAANFWADEFHVDALRFCGVSDIIYRDHAVSGYTRSESENSEGVALIRFINDSLHKQHHGFICIAEETTSRPLVTAPPYAGGLGFDYKWNLGWVSDTMSFMQDDPVYHPYHHRSLTFPMMYAFSENHILPLSHDHLEHGRRSYLSKMSGGYASQMAQLRLLLCYQFTHPGKKMNFMGTELGLTGHWDFTRYLDWDSADDKMAAFCRALNNFYRANAALYACDDSWEGYRWLNANDADRSVISFMRMANDQKLIVLCNFAPLKWSGYQVPLPEDGEVSVVFSSDAKNFGGSGDALNVKKCDHPVADMPYGFSIDLPAFSTIILAYN